MNDTVRVLLVAGILSAAAVGALAWRVLGEDASSPERLVGELRLSRWVAVLVCALGAMMAGLALGSPTAPVANLDAAAGLVLVGVAGLILQREPSEGLFIGAIACAMHAVWNLAHRPDLLGDAEGLGWYRAGSATYAVCLAAVSYWARRR